jgi:predicted permease
MVSALVLQTAPVRDPARLWSVLPAYGGPKATSEFSYPLYEDFRDQAKSFSGVTAYFPLLPASIGGQGDPERIWGQLVTENYFDVVKPPMLLGRGFTKDEAKAQVLVLSHGLWQRKFGGDPRIVGKSVPFSSRPYTVVGVTGPGFRGLDLGFNAEVWTPLDNVDTLMSKVAMRTERGSQWLQLAVRLRDDVTPEQARSEMQGLAARFAKAYPKDHDKLAFVETPAGSLHPAMRQAVFMFLGALMVVVLLVLAIACANVVNLLLAQASARQKEMAVRLSLGATRGQLMRQLITESVLLALGGGIVGVLLSIWSTQALASFRLPLPLPIGMHFGIDWKVLSYTLALSVGTGLLFGLAPALLASRPALTGALKGEDVLGGGKRRWWSLRNVLVVAQVSLSLILLCATGLFLRSLTHASSIDIGFRSGGVAMLAIDPGLHGYTRERTLQFLSQLREKAAGIPGVRSAAITDIIPLSIGGSSSSYEAEGMPKQEGVRRVADLFMITPGYFETMGTPILFGRGFENETAASPRAAVISETFARDAFGGQSPIGRRVKTSGQWYEVIGVARNIKSRTLGENTRPVLYRLLDQDMGKDPSFLGYSILLRVDGDQAAALGALRATIREMDPTLAVFNAQTMEEHLRNALFLPRLAGTLFGVFGIVGLLLASVGLYGVMSYSVSRRTREIGIRMALGAESKGVLAMIVKHGMIMTAVAMILGLAGALAAAKLAQGILYGVKPHDLVTFTAVPAFLALVAFVATVIPARRAARVAPMQALRYE